MCGNPYNTRFHFPLCPRCKVHRILSARHIQCRSCRARTNGRKALQARKSTRAE